MRGGGFPGRESDVLVGATLPSKKGQVYFVRLYLGKRRAPAVICSHLSYGNRRRFRKYAANYELAEHTGFYDNKSAGRALGHMRCGRPIKILPHTSEIAPQNDPFSSVPKGSTERNRLSIRKRAAPRAYKVA